MNFFERLKLKTTLRNCDYKLAGKVIRQQFYVTGRDAEINKLIDEYDTNPSLEAAIKLIDYNEMLVFYFTESCTGGLYIRNNETEQSNVDQDVQATDNVNLALETEEQFLTRTQENLVEDDTIASRFSINPAKLATKVVDPDKIQHLEESYNWMKDMISKQHSKSATSFDHATSAVSDEGVTEGNLELNLDVVDITIDSDKTKQPQSTKRVPIITDIEQINLAIDNDDHDMQTATLVIDTKSIKHEIEKIKNSTLDESVVSENIESTVQIEDDKGEEQQEEVVEINLSVDNFEITEHAETSHTQEITALHDISFTKPKREIEVFYETAPLEDLPDWVNEVDQSIIADVLGNKSARPFDYMSEESDLTEPLPISPTEPAKSIVSDLIGSTPPNMDTAPLKSILEEVKATTSTERVRAKMTFANIIQTIQLDIDAMRKQLNELKRELKINPWDSDQLQATIYSLEDAIFEFHEAIRILNENKQV